MKIKICFHCKRLTETVIDMDNGDLICTECGFILDSDFFEDYTAEDDDGHITLTVNGGIDRDSLKYLLKSSDDLSTLSQTQKLIKKAFQVIQRITKALKLHVIIEARACEIISKFDGNNNKKLHNKGKMFIAYCAASVLMACTKFKHSRTTLKEISMVVNCVDLKDIRRASMVIKRLLESVQAESALQEMITKNRKLVNFYCSELSIPHREAVAIKVAVEKARKLDKWRNPKLVLAAVIFMVSQISRINKRPIRKIGIVTEVMEDTIKNTVKDMYPYALKIIPDSYACEADITNMLGGIIRSWDSAKVIV